MRTFSSKITDQAALNRNFFQTFKDQKNLCFPANISPIFQAVHCTAPTLYTPYTAHSSYTPDNHQQHNKSNHSKYATRAIAGLSAFFIAAAQILPEPDEYIYTRCKTDLSNDSSLSNHLKWAFLLLGTGFCSTVSSHTPSFEYIRASAETYMQDQYGTHFTQHPNNNRPVFYRGEYAAGHEKIYTYNRGILPFSTCTTELSPPTVVDHALEDADKETTPGFTSGVTSMTCLAEVAISGGFPACETADQKVVLLIAPKSSASTSQHLHGDPADYSEYEIISIGAHRNEVLGAARLASDYTVASFLPNTKFPWEQIYNGEIKLHADEQLAQFANVCTDEKVKKALLKCIDYSTDYPENFRSDIAESAEAHAIRVTQKMKKPVKQYGYFIQATHTFAAYTYSAASIRHSVLSSIPEQMKKSAAPNTTLHTTVPTTAINKSMLTELTKPKNTYQPTFWHTRVQSELTAQSKLAQQDLRRLSVEPVINWPAGTTENLDNTLGRIADIQMIYVDNTKYSSITAREHAPKDPTQNHDPQTARGKALGAFKAFEDHTLFFSTPRADTPATKGSDKRPHIKI